MARIVRKLLRLLLLALATVILLWAASVAAYRWVEPPVTPLMLIRLAEGEGLERSTVPLDRISPHLARAVIAAEDNLFCRHRGVDWREARIALAEWRDRGRRRGASTITMQTARNLFLWPGGGPPRKVVEIGLAHAIDAVWPKDRVMAVYLNAIEWGPGIYGAEAAARAHFGKAAADLTRREAALLAAVLPNPRRWSAARPTAYIQGRAQTIERRIGQLGPLLDCVP